MVFTPFPFALEVLEGGAFRRCCLMAIRKDGSNGEALIADIETGVMRWKNLAEVRLDMERVLKIGEHGQVEKF